MRLPKSIPRLIEQPDWRPTRKIAAAAGIGGPASIVVMAIINTYLPESVSAEVSGAIASLITIAVTFISGYVVKDREQ